MTGRDVRARLLAGQTVSVEEFEASDLAPSTPVVLSDGGIKTRCPSIEGGNWVSIEYPDGRSVVEVDNGGRKWTIFRSPDGRSIGLSEERVTLPKGLI